MAEEIRRVDHYSVSIPDKVGEGARVLGALRDAGVNLTAFWGYPAGKGRAQLEFIPEDSATFVAVAKKTKLKMRKRVAFYVHGGDRPGAVADILKKLADSRISLGAMQAVCGGAGTYGAGNFPFACCCTEGCNCPGSWHGICSGFGFRRR